MTHALKEKTGPAPKKGVTPNMYIAQCGAESKTIDGMTGWTSDVDCVECISKMVRHHASNESANQIAFVLPGG